MVKKFKKFEKIHMIIFSLFILLSIISISYPFLIKKNGVVITDVSKNSACKDILIENSIITSVNNVKINDPEVFYKEIEPEKRSYRFLINSNPRVCEIENNSKIDIKVESLVVNKIKFGIDVSGGKKILIDTKGNIEETIKIIEKRGNGVGLSDFKIKKTNDFIEMIYLENEEYEVKKIASNGIVEFKLPQRVKIKNSIGEIKIGDEVHEFNVENNEVVLDGSSFGKDDEFLLDDVKFEISEISQNETVFFMDIFDDRNVLDVLSGPQYSRIIERGKNLFQFIFQIEIDSEASKKFEKITKNQELVITGSGESMLKEQMTIFIDDDEIIKVPIFDFDAGEEVSKLNIIGLENSRKSAENKMNYLITFLNSNRIQSLEIVGYDEIKGNQNILRMGTIGILAIGLIASSIITLKEKRFQKMILVIILTLSQILLLVGIIPSKLLLIFNLLLSTVFIVLKKDSNLKIKYLAVFLLFLTSFALMVNKIVIDSYLVIGLLIFSLISSLEFIIDSKIFSKKKKYMSKLNWILILFLAIVLTVLFFIGNELKVISMIVSNGVLLNIGFSKQILGYFEKKN